MLTPIQLCPLSSLEFRIVTSVTHSNMPSIQDGVQRIPNCTGNTRGNSHWHKHKRHIMCSLLFRAHITYTGSSKPITSTMGKLSFSNVSTRAMVRIGTIFATYKEPFLLRPVQRQESLRCRRRCKFLSAPLTFPHLRMRASERDGGCQSLKHENKRTARWR